MIALYIPMQPSSKTPMIAFSRCSWAASARPSVDLRDRCRRRRGRARGSVSWASAPVSSQVRRHPRAQSSVKSSLHSAEWAHARLGQARGEVEHADEPGPLAAPVGDDEDRPAVGPQAGQDVVAVLPDGLDDDERRVRREPLEDLDARALAVDEAVPVLRVDGVAAPHRPAERGDRRREVVLELALRRPARHVRRGPQVAARDGVDGARLRGRGRRTSGMAYRSRAVHARLCNAYARDRRSS